MTTTYLTVAIPYVNAAPHLGYAYELVEADIWARARRSAGGGVRFLGGTDDHSLKNVLAAEREGAEIRAYVDRHARRFEALADPLALSFDDFIRTSADPRHRPSVTRLWEAVAAGGDLYRRRYEGDYCVGCEQFYDASELPDGRCPDHGTRLERVAEGNWFFRLSRFQQQLLDLVESDRLRVRPEPFRNEVLSFVRRGLEDISVSRSVARARGWGIPVPGDPDQVVHVWFDALTNYVSALGFGDPDSAAYGTWWCGADQRVHVVGKGILRFHAVYWPAFLLSAGQPPPTRIQVHPYLTVDGAKISKSAGTTVDPVAVVDRYGVDALRWWFAREVHPSVDTDFSAGRLVARANEDLARGLGNVVNRIATLVHRSLDAAVPPADGPCVHGVDGLAGAVEGSILEFDLRAATQLVVDAVAALNRDLEATEPWKLAKDPTATDALREVLARQHRSAVEISRACAPIVPGLADRLVRQLGVGGASLPEPTPLVPLREE